MSRSRTSIFRGFLSILLGKVGVIIISALSTPVVVRILGPQSYGVYAYIISMMSVLTLVSNFGFNDGVRKFIAENPNNQNAEFSIYFFYMRSGLVISTLFSAFLFSIAFFNIGVIPDEYHVYLYFLCLIIILNQVFQISRYALMGLGKERRSEALNVLFKFGSTICGILLAAYGFGVAGLLTGHILSVLPIGLIAAYMVWTAIGYDRLKKPDRQRPLLTYGMLSFALVFLTSSLYHVDILLLGAYSKGSELGYYKAALVVAEFLWFVPQSAQTVLLHSTSGLWKENNVSEISTIVTTVTRFTLIFTLLCTIGLFVLAEEFVAVYFGSGFSATVQPLKILLPGVLLFALARPIFAVGQGKGDMKWLVLATLFAAVLNVVLNVLFIPVYGMTGAAVATSISYGSMLIFHLIAAFKLGFNPVSDLRLLRTIGCGVFTYIVLFHINQFLPSGLISIVVVAIIGLLVYLTAILTVDVTSRREMKQIISMIK